MSTTLTPGLCLCEQPATETHTDAGAPLPVKVCSSCKTALDTPLYDEWVEGVGWVPVYPSQVVEDWILEEGLKQEDQL